jgi:hypothetical protein
VSAFNKTKREQEGKHHDLEDVGISALKARQAQERLEKYSKLREGIKKFGMLSIDESGKRRKDISPEDLAVNIQNAIYQTNDMVNEVGAPFGGAGDTSWFAEARMGWQEIYTQCLDMSETLQSLLELKDAEANLQDPKDDEEALALIKASNNIKEILKIIAKRNPVTYIKSVIDQRMLNSSKMSLVRGFYAFTLVEFIGWAQLMHDLCWRREHTQIEWAVTIYQPPQMPMGREDQNLGGLSDPNQTYG